MASRLQILQSRISNPDSMASSHYDAVVGELYQSSYKFMQHLKKRPDHKNEGYLAAPSDRILIEKLPKGSSKFLDVCDQSHNKISSSGMMSFQSKFALNDTLNNQGSSLNLQDNKRLSSIHTDSNVDPYMHAQRALQGVWIKPHEFFKDEMCEGSDFSLKDISILMKKKGEVNTKRVVSKFQPQHQIIYG